MYIDDFIWLPDIEDKLAFKHQVSGDEAEEVFFINPIFALSSRVIEQVKMYTQSVDRRTLDAI